LIGAKRTAAPFARLAVLAFQTRARRDDPRLAERASQRSFATPVANADNDGDASSSPGLRRP
jgi:hypothetical protein